MIREFTSLHLAYIDRHKTTDFARPAVTILGSAIAATAASMQALTPDGGENVAPLKKRG